MAERITAEQIAAAFRATDAALEDARQQALLVLPEAWYRRAAKRCPEWPEDPPATLHGLKVVYREGL